MWPGTESNCRHEDFQSSALPTELPGQKFGILRKSAGESRIEALSPYSLGLCFDEIDHLALQSDAVERIDLLDAGGAGHIDFG